MGQSIPTNQPSIAGSEDDWYPYINLYYTSYWSIINPPIDPNDFGEGYGIIIYDLTKTRSANCDYTDEDTTGNVRLISTYKEAMTEPVNLCVVGEFRKTLHLDGHRNPSWI